MEHISIALLTMEGFYIFFASPLHCFTDNETHLYCITENKSSLYFIMDSYRPLLKERIFFNNQ